MPSRFEMIPVDIADKIAFGAGVILNKAFVPDSFKSISANDVLCATDGGVSISVTPEYADMADGLDNCPSNTKELKSIKKYTITMSGTAKTIDAEMTKKLMGFCTVATGSGSTAGISDITLNSGLIPGSSYIANLSYVCDLGDGGYFAANLSNALNTGGFSFQSADGDKASFAFSFTAHYSASTPTVAPVKFYLYRPTTTSSGT